MQSVIYGILYLCGALGLFLFGMKLMSESLQKVAGNKMRNILASITSNRIKGIFTGFLITAIIQSSSATTVMIVSFVNAGLLSLLESIGVIMGANIGTTITAWLITILGFKVKMSFLAIPLIGLGFPLVFSKNSKRKSWGELIIGFALIFIGLEEMKQSVPDIKNNPGVLNFLGQFSSSGMLSSLIFLAAGTILTIIIQSSSATMALTLILCHKGLISFEMASAMVLGENIGTTITANLAALVGNVSAKRSARAHLIFNVFGVFWIIWMLPLFLRFISWIVVKGGAASPFESALSIPVALSIFHTVFNVTNTAILVWFAPLIEKTVIKLVPYKEIDEEFRLKYINVGTVSTAELSILQAKKEISLYAQRAHKMLGFLPKLIDEQNKKKSEKLLKKIQKYEDIIDRMEVEIANYLTAISQGELGKSGSKRVIILLKIIEDIESFADTCFNIGQSIRKMKEDKIKLPHEVLSNIHKMIELVQASSKLMVEKLDKIPNVNDISDAVEIENKINHFRDSLRDEHLLNIKAQKYKYTAGLIYTDIFHGCEKIGDFIFNISRTTLEAE